MKIKEIINHLEAMAPLAYAEDFDNVGLLVGNENNICSGVLVCNDAIETVIEEAIQENCNLIVCFHPILFSSLKKITGKNYVERAIIKAIEYKIAIFAIHTALDNHINGVNKIFCDALGLRNTKILIPKPQTLRKLVTYTVTENFNTLREALFAAGAGNIGNYSDCSFSSKGTGTYKGNDNSNPVIGIKNQREEANEIKIELLFEKHNEKNILNALFSNHIYEEVAYEIYSINNTNQNMGLGMVGEFETEYNETEFLQLVKEKMDCGVIRHSSFLGKKIKRVAVLGGSGSFAINQAIQANVDSFLTADLKYHQFFEAENKILLADIGHFESERFIKNYIVEFLNKKISNFAVVLSKINTNPVKYF